MKRIMTAFFLLLCISLCGCRTAMDVSKAVAEKYQTGIEALIQVSTLTGVPCDYRLQCVTSEKSTVTEILQPESIAGIKATVESETCRIEYTDLALDAMMLPIRGMTPADCFDQTVFSLRQEVPSQYSFEKQNEENCLCLTFSGETAGYRTTRIFWLKEKTLELLAGEYYLDDTLVMRMTVEAFAFTEHSTTE